MSGLELPEPAGLLPFLHIGNSAAPMFSVPTYFLILSLTFCLSLFWIAKRTQARGLQVTTAMDLCMIAMITGFLGARIMHVLYEAPEFYVQNPLLILQFWRGGFVFYGGLLTGLASCLVFLRFKKISVWDWLDVFAPVLAFGYLLGRSACLAEGCCYGRPWEWGVKHFGMNSYFARYPTQAFAMAWEAIGLMRLLKWERGLRVPGIAFFFWLGWHSLGRIMMEYWRTDFRGPMLAGLSVSTWISFALLLLAIGFLHRLIREGPTSDKSTPPEPAR